MSYTIGDIDSFVNEGWDVQYRPYIGNGQYGETLATEHMTGWHEFRESAGVRRSRWDNNTASFVKLPEEEIEYFETPLGRIEVIDSHGGEGQGEDYWFVFTITDADGNVRTFKRHGWYASYNGGYYDGPTREVKAREKVITVWDDV